ncbi:hypothetical protein [Alicyclobacillus acidocaldarius]|uniref:Copper amine oxidase domain protein n=1 Tax=Alicyclobacillus acidocaldarius (strain Tc-4-1) TaxID=1048834 RepID=F8ILB9_ALIAT|nr:hypothetical protein [Alicyclobacillus acidocaldarius]AEJ43685.1 hypothetical protein TC41_1759 [Alicyclobacillus acidocaldarius subsp. acidocaldarius Tc-4-1]
MKKMAWKAALALAAAAPMAAVAPTAFAAQQTYKYYPTVIVVNDVPQSTPEHIVAPDPFGGGTGQATSFLPIYYVDKALAQLGIQAEWNGGKGVLNLVAPSTVKVSYPSSVESVPITSGTMVIEVNGKPVIYAPRITYQDYGAKDETTFVPIYYLEQALGDMGVQTDWQNGSEWDMTLQSVAASANQPVTYETQQQMADAMWELFDGLPKMEHEWNVPSLVTVNGNATIQDETTYGGAGVVTGYPTMQQVGVTPDPNATVTAGQVATWLADWAAYAVPYTDTGLAPSGNVQTFLASQGVTDPFTWAEDNDLFQDTGITDPNAQLTTSEAQTVLSNLQWWLDGYKEQNGVYTLHAPIGYGAPQLLTVSQWLSGTSDWSPQAYQEAIHAFDRVKVWLVGNQVNVELPYTGNSQDSYNVSSASVPEDVTTEYYAPSVSLSNASQYEGGTTISFVKPNELDFLIGSYVGMCYPNVTPDITVDYRE